MPVSPALESELERQRSALESNLSQRLGSNWSESTPGIQAMSEFDKGGGLLREEARRGQISTGEGLIQARLGQMQGAQAQQYGQGQGFGLPSFGALSGGYAQAFQPYQFNRQMEQSARGQSAANKAGLISGAMGMLGTGAGLYAGLRPS